MPRSPELEEILGAEMLECEAMDGIRQRLHRHVCPSVQIGSGKARSGAGLKFHAVVHALRLLSATVEDLAGLLKSIRVFLSDQGTESVFALLEPVPLSSLLPPDVESEVYEGVDFAPEAPVEEPDFSEPMVGRAAEATADVTTSLEVDDILHCIHNATKGLSSAMTHFSQIVSQCKHVADIVRKKDSKDRLIETCFARGVARGFVPELREFKSYVHEERCGTVSDVVTHLLGIQSALRYGWDLAAYQLTKAAAEQDAAVANPEEEDGYGVRVHSVNAAIQSDFFWAYLQGVRLLACALETCLAWAEPCPCHWARSWSEASAEQVARWRSCPLRTRRCPEMAAGEFLKLLQETRQPLLL